MKRSNQNSSEAAKIVKQNRRPAFSGKLTQKSHTLAATIILALIVLHFASQFVFFQDEEKQTVNLEAEKIPLKIQTALPARSFPSEPTIFPSETDQVTTEVDAENIKAAAIAPKKALIVTRKSEIAAAAPSRTLAPRIVTKKKEVRESKAEIEAERLRRAEKILTGF